MKPSTTPKKVKVTTNSSLLSRGVETKKAAEKKLQGVGKKIAVKAKTRGDANQKAFTKAYRSGVRY